MDQSADQSVVYTADVGTNKLC